MRFPKFLVTKNRNPINEKKIRSFHSLFARHKPDSDWKKGEEFPDFSKIRSNQSFNWNCLSTPSWVRFNDKKEYLGDYGVVRYSVETMKNAHIHDLNIPESLFGIKHEPLEFNYSHCEIYPEKGATNKNKRAWRMILIHKCKVEIEPFGEKKWFLKVYDLLLMYLNNIQMLIGKE